ncbi:MAG: heavy metal translocating P-type ATPase [Phycisphaerales bacterium]
MTKSVSDRAEPFLLTPKGELASAIVAGVCLVSGFLLTHADVSWIKLAGDGLSLVALAIGLFFGVRSALEGLKKGAFDIDVLMVVGAVLAAYIGAVSEGALLLFLFLLSGALEALAMQRTTRAVEALGKLMPTSADKLVNGLWTAVDPEALVPGDRVRLKVGDVVPTDCRLASGSTSMNQATLTGESQPRDVQPGADLYAGTLNVGNPVEAVVTKPVSQSSLQKIVELVTQAQQQREPVQRLIDKINQPYAIGVFAAAIATFFGFWLVVNAGLPKGAKDAAYTAITLLIVASPCALVIATPTATLAAISRAARGGVLFKGGSAIERLARMRAVAFDKTGTLTVGRPRVMKVHPVAWSSEQQLLGVAAGLEQSSTHPIAQAIIEAAKEQGIAPLAVTNEEYITGRGVVGVVDGHEARLGSLKHVEELITVCFRKNVAEVLSSVQHRGEIGTVVAWRDQVAVIMMVDAVRPGAECLVPRLHEQGVRPVVMLTGDNQNTAATIAEMLELDEFHAQLLPGQKVEQVQRLKTVVGKGHGVGVIGDGVNDSPALAAADVSMGIGSIGSDAALESADIVLLSDDLSTVPWSLGLARRARRTITINLVFALSAMALMAIGVILGALAGFKAPLWMGVVGHEGGTLLVVAHSLLLLAYPGIPVCGCGRHEEAAVDESKRSEVATAVPATA